MTLKGQTNKALAIGMIASFIGNVGGIIIAWLLSERIANVAFMLGPWEYFALCFVAITLVVGLSRGNVFKGLGSASLGLLLTTTGASPIDGIERFTFGSYFLTGGFSLFAVLMGVFGLSQILTDLGLGNYTLAKPVEAEKGGLGLSLGEILKEWVNILRSFIIGLWIGFLPGLGAGLSNLVAYSSAKNASKHPETFGKGDPAGLWASETSNNAAIGGALIPMTSLGIPGDTVTAILIGALTVHGLQMGPMVFKSSGNIVYLIFASVLVVSVFVFIVQLFTRKYYSAILKIPHYYLYPALAMLLLINSYVDSNNLFNTGLMMLFVVVGIVMTMGKLPTSPFILAYVLGPTIESNLLKGFQYAGSVTSFFTRPISAFLIFAGVASIAWPGIKSAIARKRQTAGAAS
jgi:putative tricarboxylic transport membrane protein